MPGSSAISRRVRPPVSASRNASRRNFGVGLFRFPIEHRLVPQLLLSTCSAQVHRAMAPPLVRGPWRGPRQQVQDGRDAEPASCGPDVREVGESLLVWPVGLEVAVQPRRFLRTAGSHRLDVGDDRPLAVILRLATAFGSRSQGIAPHQPLDPVKAAGQPLVRYKRSPGPFASRSKSSGSRQTRRAPQVRSLAWKLVSIAVTSLASWISRRLVGRTSQAWKPERKTSSTSRSRLTGQMWRCLAMKANRMSIRLIARTDGTISLKPARKKLLPSSECHAPQEDARSRVRLNRWRSPAQLVLRAAISARSAGICPFPGKAAAGRSGVGPSFGPKAVRPPMPHPAAQNALGNIRVTGGLSHRCAPIRRGIDPPHTSPALRPRS